MNKIKKIQILLDVIILLLIVFLVSLNIFFKKDDNTVTNIDYSNSISRELNDSEEVDFFTFSESTLIYVKDYKTTISVNITNNSDSDYYIKYITAFVYDSNDKEIATLYGGTKLIINSSDMVIYTFETSKEIIDDCKYIKYVPEYVKNGDENE